MNYEYRFPKWKDATWNSYERHLKRYETIKHLLGNSSVGAELGVYKGGFGEFLKAHCKKLYLVDPWFRLKPFWGNESPENSSVAALINILNVYKHEIENGSIVVVPDFSINFLQSVEDDYFDWIYLDASHTFEQTRRELHYCFKKVRSNGYIIGDDYDPDVSSNQHGVYRAVNEMSAKHGKNLILNSSRQWALKVQKRASLVSRIRLRIANHSQPGK